MLLKQISTQLLNLSTKHCHRKRYSAAVLIRASCSLLDATVCVCLSVCDDDELYNDVRLRCVTNCYTLNAVEIELQRVALTDSISTHRLSHRMSVSNRNHYRFRYIRRTFIHYTLVYDCNQLLGMGSTVRVYTDRDNWNLINNPQTYSICLLFILAYITLIPVPFR